MPQSARLSLGLSGAVFEHVVSAYEPGVLPQHAVCSHQEVMHPWTNGF